MLNDVLSYVPTMFLLHLNGFCPVTLSLFPLWSFLVTITLYWSGFPLLVSKNIFHLFLSLQVCLDSTDWVCLFPTFFLFLFPVCVSYILLECIPLKYHMFYSHSTGVFHIQTFSSFHSVCWVWWTIHVTLYRSAFGLFILDSTGVKLFLSSNTLPEWIRYGNLTL